MGIVAGVDGCPGGWLCITKDLATGAIASAVYRKAVNLFNNGTPPEIIAIDIPIGLTEKDPRQCDHEARNLSKAPRRSSVFPTPIRPALEAKDRFDASKLTSAVNGRKVGVQLWGIFPKIRETDEVLRANPHIQGRVYEVHPELCFWYWKGQRSMKDRKKSSAGKAERRRLIDAYFGEPAVKQVRATHSPREVGIDDVHNAFAALWTAQRISEGTALVVPEPPPLDSQELRMGIWY
jgi:predicted RNase H-like nuclease